MAIPVKLSLILTAVVIFCFAEGKAQSQKDSVHAKAKKDTLKVSEYAKLVYSPANNRAKMLPETTTQTVFYKDIKTIVPPSNKPGISEDQRISIHPTPIPAVTGQTVLLGAPGKEYYYNPNNGLSYKKKY